MEKILIHANYRKHSVHVKKRLESLIKSRGKTVVTKDPDVIFVIGGDGTMLSAIRKYKGLEVPFLGIDTGTLGFLTTMMPSEMEAIFDILDEGKYRITHYPLLAVNITTITGDVYTDYAFNEITIKHLEPRLMEAEVYFNERAFNYFTGDGFIISTPMGATGYAIWAGGAVMHSDLQTFQITPLMPNDNSVNRPMSSTMILPQTTKVDLKVIKAYKRKVVVACDGKQLSNQYIEKINVKVSDYFQVSVIRLDHFDYFDLFKRKIIDKKKVRQIEDN